MNIKLLAIDMDGTTLNSKNTLSAENQAALECAIQSGVYIVPTTGRQYSGLPPELQKVHGIRYCLCSNGAVVYDCLQKKVLYQDLMDCSLALRVLDELSCYPDVSCDVYIGGKAYTTIEHYQDPMKYGISPVHLKSFLDSRTPVPDLQQFVRSQHLRPEKVFSIFQEMQECRHCWDQFCTWPELAVTTSLENVIELTSATATKGNGLQVLAGLLHIPQEAVMAVGDGHNDITMLDWAGTSVAMGNANAQIRQHAAFVTDDCDHDGLAKAVRRFISL
ncbi:Cof-type HAD-IIB family hydrolase [Caproicibacterium sp. XB2]|jgi:hypothetical protein|uniref:Cof-type HAD-IIB family hydrolase n=1 Tax=Caproicibacterium TaxID=2834348 RepID=UPI000A290217|nr:hypothetical protein B6259_04195 [Ruminococcaceae bacterium CPB6]